MALKTILFFIIILILAVLASLTIETKSLASKKAATNIPSIEFGLFEAYRIKEDGIKEAVIADRGLHYTDKDVLFKGYVFVKDKEGITSANGDKIVITKEKVIITGNGHFIDSKSHELYSDNAVYERGKKFLTGKGPFRAIIGKNIITGRDLLVDGEERIIRGFKVNAKIDTQSEKTK